MTSDYDSDGLISSRWRLRSEDERKYGMEQYKLYIEMADRISARRATVNNMFLGVNTALAGAAAVLAGEHLKNQPSPRLDLVCAPHYPVGDGALTLVVTLLLLMAAAGCLVCAGWVLSVRSYAVKTEMKARIHDAVESQGWVPLKLFWKEGVLVNERSWLKPSRVEYILPAVFYVLYSVGIWLLPPPRLRLYLWGADVLIIVVVVILLLADCRRAPKRR